jgi:hypothetical protein
VFIMKRLIATLAMAVILSSILAGCIGDNLGGGQLRAFVKVDQVDDHTFVFDARDSTGRIASFNWDFGDGTTSTEARVEHHYQYGDATYTVRLVIEDENGVLDVWEDEIIAGSGVNPPPVAQFRLPTRTIEIDRPLRVDASASYDPDGAPLTYRWDFNHLMDFEEYEAFRAAKKASLDRGNGDDGDFDIGGDSTGAPMSAPPLPDLRAHDPTGLLGEKHPGHGDDDNRIQPSLFSHTVETDEPVYTLESGYPDATTFFVRLQVWDAKGGHEEIISEDIWAIEAVNPGRVPDKVIRGSQSGEFMLGLPSEISEVYEEVVPDLGLIGYRSQFTFDVPWPVALPIRDGMDFYPGGYINLTWTTDHDSELQSQMEMSIITPGGTELSVYSPRDGVLRAEIDGTNDYQGENWDNTNWRVQIVARGGVEIDWTFSYWIRLDTNPYSDIE